MDIIHGSPMTGARLEQVKALLAASGLSYDEGMDFTVLLADDGIPIATGSRQGNILKCVAVAPDRQGEGLAATLLTELYRSAVAAGQRKLFLYTKPGNGRMFSDLGFYEVAQTPDVLFMENTQRGVDDFIAACKAEAEGVPAGEIAAVVANANPFTNGHLHLITEAAKQTALLHVFVLSEDKSSFPAADRLRLVREGTARLPNVRVHPTDSYLVSAATFPGYFLKDKEAVSSAQYELDLTVFAERIALPMGITRRFVGEEPLCPVTRGYNEAMLALLPPRGISVTVLPRVCAGGAPVSASRVRALLAEKDWPALRPLVPDVTYEYLRARGSTDGLKTT